MVKTAASHAVNIGSNPVWVTKENKAGAANNRNPRKTALYRKGKHSSTIEFVLIAMRVHLFPSRTQKLSSSALTILGGRLPGKISNANTKPRPKGRGFFLPASLPRTLAVGRTIPCPAWEISNANTGNLNRLVEFFCCLQEIIDSCRQRGWYVRLYMPVV